MTEEDLYRELAACYGNIDPAMTDGILIGFVAGVASAALSSFAVTLWKRALRQEGKAKQRSLKRGPSRW